MGNQPPQWISGVLYGTGKLEVYQGNDIWFAIEPVIVQFNAATLRWSLALRLGTALAESLLSNSYKARLFDACFAVLWQSEPLRLEELEFQEIRCPWAGLLDEQRLAEWDLSPEVMGDFPRKYLLVDAVVAENASIAFEVASACYAVCYRLPKEHWPAFQSSFLLDDLEYSLEISEAGEHQHVVVWSTENWSTQERRITTVLELLLGYPLYQSQSIERGRHQLFRSRSNLPASLELFSLLNPFALGELLRQGVEQLSLMHDEAFRRFMFGSRYYVLSNVDGLIEEIRFTMQMMVVELWDGTDQLTYAKTGRLLGLGANAAELLQEVRNKLMHEAGSLHSAYAAALAEIFESEKDKVGHRKKPIVGLDAQAKHCQQMRKELGLPIDASDEDLIFRLSFRLTERIQAVIWQRLGLSVSDLKYSDWVRWPGGDPPAPGSPELAVPKKLLKALGGLPA